MPDVFLMHRAASTHEAQLRFALMQARADLTSKTIDYDRLAEDHEKLVDSYITDAEAQREAAKKIAELEARVDDLSTYETALKRDLVPSLGMAYMAISMLNREIKKWTENKVENVSLMPIDPKMAEAFRLLEQDMSRFVKTATPEQFEEMIKGVEQ